MESTSVITKKVLVLLVLLYLPREGAPAKVRRESEEEDFVPFKNSKEPNYELNRRSIFHDVGVERLLSEDLVNHHIQRPRRPLHREHRKRGYKDRETTSLETRDQDLITFEYRDKKKNNKVVPGDWSKPGGFGDSPWGKRMQYKKQTVKGEGEKVKGPDRVGKGWIGWGYWG